MTTENSFHAAPVEPIGDADNALNVTVEDQAEESAALIDETNVEADCPL